MRKLGANIVEEGGYVCAINYAGSYDLHLSDENIKVIDVSKEGISIPILIPLKKIDGKRETKANVTEAALEIFNSVSPISSNQKMELRNAIALSVENNQVGANELALIKHFLEVSGSEDARKVLDRYWYLFEEIQIRAEKTAIFEPQKITVFDLSGISRKAQLLVTELLLAIFWRYFQLYGQYLENPVFLMCDEFKNLRIKKGSTIEQILSEGRKFHLSLILATQTLQIFEVADRSIITQAGTRLVFEPDAWDKREIVRMVPDKEKRRVSNILDKLTTGNCLAMGEFESGGYKFTKNLRMTFREN